MHLDVKLLAEICLAHVAPSLSNDANDFIRIVEERQNTKLPHWKKSHTNGWINIVIWLKKQKYEKQNMTALMRVAQNKSQETILKTPNV